MFDHKGAITTYTVSLNANGGTLVSESQITNVMDGDVVSKAAYKAENDTKLFLGWANTADATQGGDYTVKASDAVDGTITLYAVFTIKKENSFFVKNKDSAYDKTTNPMLLDGAADWKLIADAIKERQEVTACYNDGTQLIYVDVTAAEGGYMLTTDLDYTGKEFPQLGVEINNPFQGFFDGGDHTITGVTNCNGIFGYAGGATIQNVKVSNSRFVDTSYAGTIVGHSGYTLTIQKCTVENTTVQVTSPNDASFGSCTAVYAGGIVGMGEKASECKVTGCTVAGCEISAQGKKYRCGFAGGIVGGSKWVRATNCVSTATVTGDFAAGGITAGGGTFVACRNYGDVTAPYVGGIAAGRIYDELGVHFPDTYNTLDQFKWVACKVDIQNCGNDGAVTCDLSGERVADGDKTDRFYAYGGGLAACGFPVIIKNSFNTGAVTLKGDSKVWGCLGGLAGLTVNSEYIGDTAIQNSYNLGTIHTVSGTLNGAGGILGRYHEPTSCENDVIENVYSVSQSDSDVRGLVYYAKGIKVRYSYWHGGSENAWGTDPSYNDYCEKLADLKSETITGLKRTLTSFATSPKKGFFSWYINPAISPYPQFVKGASDEGDGNNGAAGGITKPEPEPGTGVVVPTAITYTLNGGVNHPLNKSTVAQMAGQIPYDPSRSGFTFMGWYQGDTKFESSFTGEEMETVTLTARWKALAPAAVQRSDVTLGATKLTVRPTEGQEYCISASPITDFTTVTWTNGAFTERTATTKYYIYTRIKEVSDGNTSLASEPSKALEVTTLAADPTYSKAARPVLVSRTDTTVTVEEQTNCAYAISTTNDNSALSWQASPEFQGLSANTTYYVFARPFDSTDTAYISDSLSVTTLTTKPNAPTVKFETINANQIKIRNNTYAEYRIKGGAWQDSNVFTNLEANTRYLFEERIKATETSAASDITAAYATTLRSAPKPGEGCAVDYKTETIEIYDGYVVYLGSTPLKNGGKVTPGATYKVCVKADETLAEGERYQMTLPARPAAPTSLTVVHASGYDVPSGKIEGVTTNMEYAKSGTTDYLPITQVPLTGLASGTYYVRTAATSSQFAGNPKGVSVGILKQTFTVTFMDGTELLGKYLEQNYGTVVTAPTLAVPEGKVFAGWYEEVVVYDDPTGTDGDIVQKVRRATDGKYTVVGNVTLCAEWLNLSDLFANTDLDAWHKGPFDLTLKPDSDYQIGFPAGTEEGQTWADKLTLDQGSTTDAGTTQPVLVKDRYGNQITVDITYKLDAKKPVVRLAATANNVAYDGTAWTAYDVVITPSNPLANLSGVTYFYQKAGDADWVALKAAALTVDWNCNTDYIFKAVSGAGLTSETATIHVKRSALTPEEIAKTAYGKDDFTPDKDKNTDGWYSELPTVTVTPKDTVGVGGLKATTYYELYKNPATSGTKTELTAPWTITPTEEGIWTLNVWTEDVSGNKTKPYTMTVMVDTTAPVVVVDGMGADGVNKSWDDTKEITIHVTDALSGVNYIGIFGGSGNMLAEYGRDESFGALNENGVYKITVRVNDNYSIMVNDVAGSSVNPGFIVEKIDGEKPVATFGTLTPNANGWFTSAVTVNVTIDDPETISDNTETVGINESNKSGIAKWEYSVDGGAHWSTGNGTSFTIVKNGDYTNKIQIKSTDHAGNVSDIATTTVKLDKDTPAVPTVTAKAGDTDYDGSFTGKDVVFTLNGTPTTSGHAKYQYSTDGASWQDVTDATLTHAANTPDAGVSYQFRAVNKAGKESAASSAITVKRRALDQDTILNKEGNKYANGDITIDGEGVTNNWYTENVTVIVTPKTEITDGQTSYPADTYYKTDDGGEKKLEAPWKISIAEDGTHKLEIWTKDAAGNETTHLIVTIKIDKTAPNITEVMGNPNDWQNKDAAMTFTAADATSGIKIAVVTCDDGKTVTQTSGGFTADRNGTYTITVTDNAGHPATQDVKVTKIDKAAPVISNVDLTGTEGKQGWYTTDVTVAVTATDADGSNIKEYSFDGGATWQAASSMTYHVNGIHTVTVWVRDNAGNVTKQDAVAVKLDKDTPAVPTVTAKAGDTDYDGSFTGKDVVFTLDGTSTTSGHAKYQYSTDGASWQDVTAATLTHAANTPDAGVSYQFRAVNKAGKESAASSAITVKRRALDDSVLTNPDNSYQPGELNPGQQPGNPETPDKDFPYAPYWWPEKPTITVPDIPYIKDPSAPAIPGTNPAINGYEAATYYRLWRERTDAKPAKTMLTAPFEIKPNADGIWTLELWTEDVSGNETKHLIKKIQVDTTAPTITDVTGNPTKWQKTDVTLSINGAADATAGLANLPYSFDGGATWQVENTKTFAANATVNLLVRDKAGEIYVHTPILINRVDKTAPVVSWEADTLALNQDKWYGAGHTVTAGATDDSGETPTITLKAGGKAYENGVTINSSGVYSFTATARDAAGNASQSTLITIRIETTIDMLVEKVSKLDENTAYKDLLKEKLWYDALGKTMQERLSKNDDATAAYEKLISLLKGKTQDAAEGVTDAINNADTIEKIEQAKKDFDALPEEAKGEITDEVKNKLEQLAKDAEAAKNVADQLENADRGKQTDGDQVEDPGASYEEKESAKDAYDKLTEDQKKLVPSDKKDLYDSITTDLAAIDAVLKELDKVKKPYTSDTKTDISNAEKAFEKLTDDQKNAFPKAEKDKLDDLTEKLDMVKLVEDLITKLATPYDAANDTAISQAKGAYDALAEDEKAMVDAALKAKLDTLYQDMLDGKSADEKATAAFIAKVEEVKNKPTVDKIKDLVDDYGKLSAAEKDKLNGSQTKTDYDKLVDDLNKAKDIIDKLDKIDTGKLTPEDIDEVKDALGKDSANGYDDLTEDQKKLVDDATNGKPGILDDAIEDVTNVTDKVDKIPGHTEDSTTTTPDGEKVPDLGDCDNTGNSGANNSGTGGHTNDSHRKAIEDAKIAYERLTDAARKLVSHEVKEKLNREYAALMAYLKYVNTAKTEKATVEVTGLAGKIELPADAATAPKTIISVVMKDEKPAIMPETPAGKSEILSVNIKLVASIYNDAEATVPAATETVQPKNGETVLIKLLLPTGYQLETLEIWHVKDNGDRSRIQDFWLVTENGQTHAIFEVGSLSHFVFFAETQSIPPIPGDDGDSDESDSTISKPAVTTPDHGKVDVTPVQPKPGDKVTITPKPDEGYVVDKVIVKDESGKEINVSVKEDGGFTFTQPNGKVTITVTFKPAQKTELPFTDVPSDAYYKDAVQWAYENAITGGTSATTFSPDMICTRAQTVTFLWRAMGSPEPTSTNCPFTDISTDAYYYKAVLWATEKGITKGTSATTFSPDMAVTRGQTVTFLYRTAGSPAAGTANPFVDVTSDAYYASAVLWAVKENITSGTSTTTFSPIDGCSRAQIVTFLYRYLSK
ncbi:MAG: S-layer homology domain-containing protein [Oscillospiraceae bacterium]|nr:S-layer homology domain-containing protein [Oscillospiraceae bacterium]